MKIRPPLQLVLFAAWAVAPVLPAFPQAPAAVNLLEVSDGSQAPLSLSAADLKAMPRTTIRVAGAQNTAPQVYEGVALTAILQRAGVPMGDREWMTGYVMAEAADGYRVVFSLAEMDPGIGSAEVLVADTLDGKPLAEGQGPFRLVVPGDRRAARWLRALKSIRVTRAGN